jgi:hypothetical protein
VYTELKRTRLEILEQVVDSRINTERIEPKGEDSSFTLSLGIKVLYSTEILSRFKRFEAWPRIEQIGDKGKVQTGIPSNERLRGQIFATSNPVSVLENLFRALQTIWGL